jgi:hypothetical protein
MIDIVFVTQLITSFYALNYILNRNIKYNAYNILRIILIFQKLVK